ncbi:hypothetical protein KI387_010859, partial [Taxus chinensis]
MHPLGGGVACACACQIPEIGGMKRNIWRMKMVPKLKLRWFNPKHVVAKLRDGYVNMMVNLADKRVFSTEMVNMGPY